jgi:hypothetical protein
MVTNRQAKNHRVVLVRERKKKKADLPDGRDFYRWWGLRRIYSSRCRQHEFRVNNHNRGCRLSLPAHSRVDASSKGRPKNLQTPKKGSQPLSSLDGICQAQSGDTASSKRAMTKVTDLARGRLRLRGDRRSEGRNTWWTLEASAERGTDWGANHGSAMRRARAGCTDAGCKPKTQDQKSVRSIVMPAAGVRACVRACGACRTGVEIKTLRGEVFRGEKKRIGKKKNGNQA